MLLLFPGSAVSGSAEVIAVVKGDVVMDLDVAVGVAGDVVAVKINYGMELDDTVPVHLHVAAVVFVVFVGAGAVVAVKMLGWIWMQLLLL
ncbi:hypothetical protein AC249_AIPGENE2016 [Exaiptasia diaphana]|nr:hypothetical protein AC249_AIPGENE2016 [Exaiptasia diaphana]